MIGLEFIPSAIEVEGHLTIGGTTLAGMNQFWGLSTLIQKPLSLTRIDNVSVNSSAIGLTRVASIETLPRRIII